MNEITLRGLAVVTGAGQGIGRVIAVRLLQAGCHVLAVGRTRSKLEGLAAEAGVSEDQVTIAGVDIRDVSAVEQMVQAAQEQHDEIAYLVNAAGILVPSKLLETDSDALAKTIAVNFTATLVFTQIVARVMAAQKAGAIVTIGSNSGTTPRTGLGAYPASKAGLAHAMKCLGLELAEHGVRCNIVSPGSTDTPMQQSFQTSASSLDRVLKGDADLWRLGIPLGRMADPQDVANIVLFLLSDMARHITMENIVIDGGATLGAR
ncbi:SDR family NAD(P)-dependent oxidoreductase [Roseovarius sp. EL26]|uniref:SDR family NAD(P)-dependent oxidoreductase n=1 Tax=Roseovarius sp. EL26 TaxID=2126672 RepID=UPI000EA37ED7|nr:SDR family NAD(P)-dependent oxidoreductase [Roseovarius sp. EL26]